jgi:DNA transposition AAA+ family ATPase
VKADVFAQTHNVRQFAAAMDRLLTLPEDMPRMALVSSKPGLGKTRTVAWYIIQHRGIHVTAIEIMTPRWFLRTLVRELGHEPYHHTEAVYEQAAGLLVEHGGPLFIDEADFLIKERISEVLRSLHDLTHVPMVFIGMENAERKFMRYRHLYDRFSERLEFTPLSGQDVAQVAAQMCEVPLEPDAVALITETSLGNFRRVKQEFRRAERIARTNGLKKISAENLGTKPHGGRRK